MAATVGATQCSTGHEVRPVLQGEAEILGSLRGPFRPVRHTGKAAPTATASVFKTYDSSTATTNRHTEG